MKDSKKVTTSMCIPEHVDIRLQSIADELSVSKSAVATSILSVAINWIGNRKMEEIIDEVYWKKGETNL